MKQDNIIPFPQKIKDAVEKQDWHSLQSEFYLDCYTTQHGKTANAPDELLSWLREVELYAELDNPFFRGWLLCRLSHLETSSK